MSYKEEEESQELAESGQQQQQSQQNWIEEMMAENAKLKEDFKLYKAMKEGVEIRIAALGNTGRRLLYEREKAEAEIVLLRKEIEVIKKDRDYWHNQANKDLNNIIESVVDLKEQNVLLLDKLTMMNKSAYLTDNLSETEKNLTYLDMKQKLKEANERIQSLAMLLGRALRSCTFHEGFLIDDINKALEEHRSSE